MPSRDQSIYVTLAKGSFSAEMLWMLEVRRSWACIQWGTGSKGSREAFVHLVVHNATGSN